LFTAENIEIYLFISKEAVIAQWNPFVYLFTSKAEVIVQCSLIVNGMRHMLDQFSLNLTNKQIDFNILSRKQCNYEQMTLYNKPSLVNEQMTLHRNLSFTYLKVLIYRTINLYQPVHYEIIFCKNNQKKNNMIKKILDLFKWSNKFL
jgi:hypothetical protein